MMADCDKRIFFSIPARGVPDLLAFASHALLHDGNQKGSSSQLDNEHFCPFHRQDLARKPVDELVVAIECAYKEREESSSRRNIFFCRVSKHDSLEKAHNSNEKAPFA